MLFLEDAGLFKNGWLVIDGVDPLDLNKFFGTVGVVLAIQSRRRTNETYESVGGASGVH